MKARMMLVLACGVLVAAQPSKEEIAKDLDKLQGNWVVGSLVIGGKEVPADSLKELRAIIKGDTYTLKVKDQVVEEGKFSIDPSKKPKTMDSTATVGPDKGKKTVAIYVIEGDTLKMCSSPAGNDKRPAEFASPAGSDNQLATYKRVK